MKTKKIRNNKFKRSINRGKGLSSDEEKIGRKRTFSNVLSKFASAVSGFPNEESESEEEADMTFVSAVAKKPVSSVPKTPVSARAPSSRVTRFTGNFNENNNSNIDIVEPTEKKRRTSAISSKATSKLEEKKPTLMPKTPSIANQVRKAPTLMPKTPSNANLPETTSKQYGKWGENRMADLLVDPKKKSQHLSASHTQGVIDICKENVNLNSNRPNINSSFQCKMSEQGKQAYELSDARQLWSYSLKIEKKETDIYYILVCYYSDDKNSIREVVDVEQFLFDPKTFWGVDAFNEVNITMIKQMLEKNVADVTKYKNFRRTGEISKATKLKESIEKDTNSFNQQITRFGGLLRVYAKLSSPTSSGEHDNSRPWQIGTDSNATKFMKTELSDVLFVHACIDRADISRAKISGKSTAKGLNFGKKIDDKTFKNIINNINIFLKKKCKKNKTRQNKKKNNKTRRKNKNKNKGEIKL